MRRCSDLAAAGLAKRAEAGLKVRQPLASMSIGAKQIGSLKPLLAMILADEVNVKKFYGATSKAHKIVI